MYVKNGHLIVLTCIPFVFMKGGDIKGRTSKHNFEIVNFQFLDGDVPHPPSILIIGFARLCSNVEDFNNRNLF